MSNKYNTTYIGDISNINANSYSSSENWEYVNYLDTGNITKNKIDEIQYIDLSVDKLPSRAKRKVIKNSIIYSTVRPNLQHFGFIDKQPENFLVSTGFAVIDINPDIANPKFVYYYLTQDKITEGLHALAEQSVSAYPSIKPSDVGNVKIFLPDLTTQEKIAKVLSSLDDKIELNNKINQNLEQQAQAIFKSWFVDNDNNIELKNGTFSDLIVSTLGGDWGKDAPFQNYTEKVLCIRGADIPEIKLGHIGKMPTRYILTKNSINKKLVNNNLVVEISGGSPTQSTGRIALITNSLLDYHNEAMICTNFCRALKTQNHYSYFIYYYWQYLYDKNTFFSYENGTTGIKNLDLTGFLENELIKIPNNNSAIKFENICSQFFKQIFQNGKENEKLAQLRDTLLPKLMNGEIDVDKVEV